MKNISNKKGISLVVLAITIAVAAVLLGAVILEVKDSNVEVLAEEASFKQSVSSFKDELDLYLNQQKLDYAANNEVFSLKKHGNYDVEETKNIVKSSIGTSFEGQLRVVEGRLKLINNNKFSAEERQWFDEVN